MEYRAVCIYLHTYLCILCSYLKWKNLLIIFFKWKVAKNDVHANNCKSGIMLDWLTKPQVGHLTAYKCISSNFWKIMIL